MSHTCSSVRNMRWFAGGTYTGEALDFARQAFGSSQLNRKVAVVLTDGWLDTRRDAKPLSSLCSVPNIRVRDGNGTGQWDGESGHWAEGNV